MSDGVRGVRRPRRRGRRRATATVASAAVVEPSVGSIAVGGTLGPRACRIAWGPAWEAGRRSTRGRGPGPDLPRFAGTLQASSACPSARSNCSPSPCQELPCMQARVVGFVEARREMSAGAFFEWEK